MGESTKSKSDEVNLVLALFINKTRFLGVETLSKTVKDVLLVPFTYNIYLTVSKTGLGSLLD